MSIETTSGSGTGLPSGRRASIEGVAKSLMRLLVALEHEQIPQSLSKLNIGGFMLARYHMFP
jgi:hypothetical protein